MKKRNVALWLSSTLFVSSAIAGTMGAVTLAPKKNWVGTISVGPAWSGVGKTQTFFLTPTIEKTYAGKKTNSAFPEGEIFLGQQKTLTDTLQGQLGIALVTTGNAKSKGAIWDDADPQFNNYAYHYSIQHTHVALKGKLLADKFNTFIIPWISGSVGLGWNRAHHFENTPTIFEAITSPNFTGHTKTAFAYTLGAGANHAINHNWQVGLGYEFESFGKSKLSRAPGQTLGSGLVLNHLYINGLLFNITYIA